ncbi:HPr family phosphocarrier protein [Porticoccaceae bacterium]|nr:HPr family phosphocarrier protein [Porticoccaceae bacterium]
MIRQQLTIVNKLGLHARAATKLARLNGSFACQIRAGKSPPLIDAKSVMSLMLLAASQGTELMFEFEGDDQDHARDEVAKLIANYFDEGE